MDYQQTLEYLYSRLPMFQRIGAAAYKADLSNTTELCGLTGNPQTTFRSVHVAGTNGKGSVSHMLASILQESGYKTALFTSPHLKDFRERMKINGKMIPEQFVCDYVETYGEAFTRFSPSFFELSFGMAMSWFSSQQVDVAVVETGMGGRLDSTNILRPLLSVITNIGYDHTRFLGNTLQAIAAEKAGIIKQQIPIVIGETHPATQPVFTSRAATCASPIIFADTVVAVNGISPDHGQHILRLNAEYNNQVYRITSHLTGTYQVKNIATVIAAACTLGEILNHPGALEIEEGIRKTVSNTDLKGRWQQLREKPLTICDIGHNTDGIRMVVDQIRSLSFNTLHFVLGVVNDKDISGMLDLLPVDAHYYFCKADIPRGLDADQLQAEARVKGLHGMVYKSVKEALNAAWESAGADDLVFVGGSAFTVAEVI